MRVLHCAAVRAICCNLALSPSYYQYCAISLKRCSYVSRVPIGTKKSVGRRFVIGIATDERNADENLACVEVGQRQEEDQADVQDPLGTLGIVPSGSSAIKSLYGHNTKRGLASGHARFERTDSVAVQCTRRQRTRTKTKHPWKPASGCWEVTTGFVTKGGYHRTSRKDNASQARPRKSSPTAASGQRSQTSAPQG